MCHKIKHLNTMCQFNVLEHKNSKYIALTQFVSAKLGDWCLLYHKNFMAHCKTALL